MYSVYLIRGENGKKMRIQARDTGGTLPVHDAAEFC
jgi:hypothetical protein